MFSKGPTIVVEWGCSFALSRCSMKTRLGQEPFRSICGKHNQNIEGLWDCRICSITLAHRGTFGESSGIIKEHSDDERPLPLSFPL